MELIEVRNGATPRDKLLENTKSEHEEAGNNSRSGVTKTDAQTESHRQCCSKRWIIAFTGLWLGITANLFSVNMSVAVVCMVKSNDVSKENTNVSYGENVTNVSYINTGIGREFEQQKTSLQNYIKASDIVNTSTFPDDSNGKLNKIQLYCEFTWSKKTQSFILSGFFYGYLLVQIPGGWLGTKFGGRCVIGCCMAMASLLTLLIPLLARTSEYLIITARILLGIFIGSTPTNFCGLIGVWALPTERSRITGLLWFGQMLGAVLAYATSGVLCVNGFDNGWASIFYLHGLFGLLFVGCWWCFVYSSPEQHPSITAAEKTLIAKHNGKRKEHVEKQTVPWKQILTYTPLYVSYIAHIGDNWTYYLLLTCLPQYLNECLHFDIQSNGLLSCLPFLSYMVGISVSGSIADLIISKKILSITNIRKLFVIVGFIGIACFILVPGFLSSDYSALAITCLSICTLFESAEMTGGYSVNSVDIAPRYASVVFGISNTVASIPGAFLPLIVAVITQNRTVEEWRVVFYMSAGVSVFSCVVYGMFANNQPAPWADLETDEIEVELSNKLSKNVSEPALEEINKLL